MQPVSCYKCIYMYFKRMKIESKNFYSYKCETKIVIFHTILSTQKKVTTHVCQEEKTLKVCDKSSQSSCLENNSIRDSNAYPKQQDATLHSDESSVPTKSSSTENKPSNKRVNRSNVLNQAAKSYSSILEIKKSSYQHQDAIALKKRATICFDQQGYDTSADIHLRSLSANNDTNQKHFATKGPKLSQQKKDANLTNEHADRKLSSAELNIPRLNSQQGYTELAPEYGNLHVLSQHMKIKDSDLRNFRTCSTNPIGIKTLQNQNMSYSSPTLITHIRKSESLSTSLRRSMSENSAKFLSQPTTYLESYNQNQIELRTETHKMAIQQSPNAITNSHILDAKTQETNKKTGVSNLNESGSCIKSTYIDSLLTMQIEIQGRSVKFQDIGIDELDLKEILCCTDYSDKLFSLSAQTKTPLVILKPIVSRLPSYYIPRLIKETDNLHNTEHEGLLEDMFLEKTYDNTFTVISDSSGMGKSTLLYYMEQKLYQIHDNRAVIFVSMIEFLNRIEIRNTDIETSDILMLMLEHVSPTEFARKLLVRAILKYNFKIQFLFDDFEKVYLENVNFLNSLLISLKQHGDNIKTYISSQPHHRIELEKLLGATSYSLCPFDIYDQDKFFRDFLQHKEKNLGTEENIEDAQDAEKRLMDLDNILESRDTRLINITSFPIICQSIADAFLKQCADLVSEALSDSSMLFQLIERKFLEDKEFAANLVFYGFKQFFDNKLSSKFKVISRATSNVTEQENLKIKKMFHIWQALKTVSSNLADIYESHCRINIGISSSEIFSCGILEAKNFDIALPDIQFVHHSFSDYLVGEFFANSLMKSNDTYFQNKIIYSFVRDILLLEEAESINLRICHSSDTNVKTLTYKLRNPNIIFFFCKYIAPFCDNSFDPFTSKSILQNIECKDLYKILLALFISNQPAHSLLLKFLQVLLKSVGACSLEKYQAYLLEEVQDEVAGVYIPRYWYLTLLCSQTCGKIKQNVPNVHGVKRYLNFFLDCFHLDILASLKQTDCNLLTPLHCAIMQNDLELTKYLIDKCPLVNRSLLYICAQNTYSKHKEFVKQREEICLLLLDACKELINEVGCDEGNNLLGCPLVANNVSLQLIIVLIKKGANIRQTYQNETLVHLAARYMTENDFYELCVYLINDCKALDLFEDTSNWKSPLYKMFNSKNNENEIHNGLKALDISKLKLKVLNNKKNNLFLCAISGGQPTVVLEQLIQTGVNYRAINDRGENAVHVAINVAGLDIVRYLLALNFDLNHKNNKKIRPLEHAVLQLAEIEKTSDKKRLQKMKEIIKILQDRK